MSHNVTHQLFCHYSDVPALPAHGLLMRTRMTVANAARDSVLAASL